MDAKMWVETALLFVACLLLIAFRLKYVQDRAADANVTGLREDTRALKSAIERSNGTDPLPPDREMVA